MRPRRHDRRGDSPPRRRSGSSTSFRRSSCSRTWRPDRAGRQSRRPRPERRDHHRKLASFGITADRRRNAGPVPPSTRSSPRSTSGFADGGARRRPRDRSRRPVAPDEAPIPGKSAPSGSRSRTRTSTSSPFAGSSRRSPVATKSKLTFALGRYVAGKAQAVDLAKMPHLLIAGATGSAGVIVNAVHHEPALQVDPGRRPDGRHRPERSSSRATTACPISSSRSSRSRSVRRPP